MKRRADDIKITAGENWTQKAQDRDTWKKNSRDLSPAVKELRFMNKKKKCT